MTTNKKPFIGVPKTKSYNGILYRLHNDCFNKKSDAQKEQDHFQTRGAYARIYKDKWYYLYIRNK